MQKILIVDDDKNYASVLIDSLKFHGFEATTVQDVDCVLEAAQAFKPDIVLLDIMMPKMAGTEVRSELLKNPATKLTPVIYLTGLRPPRYSPRSKGTANRPTGVRTVGKSGDLRELLDAIRETLEPSK